MSLYFHIYFDFILQNILENFTLFQFQNISFQLKKIDKIIIKIFNFHFF